jgi:hypothetical protein
MLNLISAGIKAGCEYNLDLCLFSLSIIITPLLLFSITQYSFSFLTFSFFSFIHSRVDVPRSGDGKHSDPYWFHPHGFRFRSIREIDRWRESGWDLNALPKTAFQEKKTDGLGISREGAIANNVLTRENLEAIKQQGSTVAVGDSTSRKRTSGAGEDGDGTGVSMKRRRQGPTYVPKSAEGLSLFTKCKEKECFRTITALAPQTVCSIYQKMTWIGDLALTHIIGVDMRCVLPKDIFVVSFFSSSLLNLYSLSTLY